MANRIPLVIANSKLREIENGDTLDLTGNALIVGGNLTPSVDSSYDLGSPTNKWRDLHLSGSTIFLGTLIIKDDNGTLAALDSAGGTSVAFSLAANTTDDLTEGSTNLYFTNARARSAISASGDLSYDSSTGVFTFDVESVYTKANFDSDLTLALATAAVTTTNLSEGTNLYYTDTRFDNRLATKTADDVAEGSTNLYFNGKTTTDLSEGTNLYYTTVRADSDAKAAISVTDAGGDGSLTYNSGVITYTGPSASEVRAHFSAGTGVTLSSGQISIGQAVGTTDSAVFASLQTTGNIVVGGNLQVSGTTTTVNSQDLTVTDNMIYMNAGESAGSPTLSVDVGWAANVNDDGSYTHVGMFRDATDNRFKVFGAYTPEPDAAVEINTGHASFALADFQASTFYGALSGNASTATALQTARTIGGVSFDGTANINLPGVNTAGNQNTSGNAATATAWATGRTISLTGDVTGTSGTFDGTGNLSFSTALAANTVSSTELVSASTLLIKDSSGSTLKTIIGAGS